MNTKVYTEDDGDDFKAALIKVARQIPPEEVFLILKEIVAIVRTDDESGDTHLTFTQEFRKLQESNKNGN